MKILDRYIDQLLEKSSPSRPIWNIEKIRQGAKPSWNYMDGCMINAILELYHITQKEEYLDFADRFIDYFVEEDGPSILMILKNTTLTMLILEKPSLICMI